LNHFTVPVAIAFPPGRSCAAKRGRCKSNNNERWHYFAEQSARHENLSLYLDFLRLEQILRRSSLPDVAQEGRDAGRERARRRRVEEPGERGTAATRSEEATIEREIAASEGEATAAT
jgi:hypothetical protein